MAGNAGDAKRGFDVVRRHVRTVLARACHLDLTALVVGEADRDVVAGAGTLAPPPEIVTQGLLRRLLDAVLVDVAGERELDGVTDCALANAIAPGDDDEARSEIKSNLVAETAKAAHLDIVNLHRVGSAKI
jgi:hypothetical protein